MLHRKSPPSRPRITSLLLLWALGIPTLADAQSEPSVPPPRSQAQAVASTVIDFDHFEVGPVSNGFIPILSGFGKDVSWVVRPEPSALSGNNVLAQTSYDQVDYRFPLLVYNNIVAKDVQVAVQFKPVSGKIDQAAGVIVRFQDPEHFYVVRANALEDTVQLYRVVKGVRSVVSGGRIHVESGQWHSLVVTAAGSRFTVIVDGQQLFEARDNTFSEAGKVGLSTKSDGVTMFDDLEVTVLDRPGSRS